MKSFSNLEDKLWAKMYHEQANAIEAQARGHLKETLFADDSGLSVNGRDEGDELNAFFDDFDGNVTNMALQEVQKEK